MTDFFIAQKNLMEQALDKLPIFPNQSTLWRGLKALDLNQIKSLYKEGNVVTEKGFVSSAHNLDNFIKSSRARDFSVIIIIEGKNGKLIEAISTLPEEAEVLFKNNTQFEVKKAGMELHPDPKFEDANGYPLIWTVILKEL